METLIFLKKIRCSSIALLVLVLSFVSAHASCKDDIRNFYVSYMTNLDNNKSANDSICNLHLSEAARLMIKDYINKTDIDPIIRAQDVSKYGIKSLVVDNLCDGWYMVMYKWDANSEYTKIPIKVCDCSSVFKIIYITPIWQHDQFGDYLLKDP